MVAGGVGLAPFATLAEALVARGTKTTLFYGARSGKELFYLDWFASRGIELKLATEDGTNGDKGRITLPLERELQRAGPADVMIYACGPEPMLRAIARSRPDAQLAWEAPMACGYGACFGCVVEIDGRLQRLCLEGPVLDARAVKHEVEAGAEAAA